MTGTDHDAHQPADTVPATTNEEDDDMTATLEHPALETVHDAADTLAGLPTDLDDIDAQIHAELDFLTSLIWSPATAAAIHALVGDHQHRDSTGGYPADRIPMNHPLFLSPIHGRIFRTVVELVDEGAPVTPQILMTRIGTTDRAARQTLITIAAPTGHGPLPGGSDVPYLSRGIVDAYYRRGYTALLARMQIALEDADTDDLAGHWTTLTNHQQAAERRRFAVTDALAKL